MPDRRTWAVGWSGRSSVIRVEHGHVEVDAVTPDAGRLQCDGGDEPQRAGAVREGADGAGSTLDFAVQAFEPVRRADAHPVLLGEGVVRRRVGEAALETGDSLGKLLREARAEAAQAALRRVERLDRKSTRLN